MRLYPPFVPEHARKAAASIIGTDHAYKDATSAKTGNVASDIAGASDHQLASRYRQDRGRRLRRDAGDVAIDELVEHQVPDAKHRLIRGELQTFFEIEHQMPIAVRKELRCDGAYVRADIAWSDAAEYQSGDAGSADDKANVLRGLC